MQLYSLRDDAREDLAGTLAAIAAIGYRDVELLGSMGNFGMPPTQLRRVLDANDLRASSTHISGSVLDDLERQLDDALTLSHRYMVVASLPIEGRRTLDDYRRWADRLNEAGQRTLSRGVHLGFHNHANDHKDVPQLGATRDTELGRGVIDLRRLLGDIEDIDDKLLFVEQETYPGAPLESVRRDYSYITSLEF